MIQTEYPMMASKVAKKVGMTPDGVLKCAHRMGLGTKIGSKFLIFDEAEVEQITNNRPKVGRPKSDG